MMTFVTSKTWGHEVGLSCCFRQWRAKSHCQLLHGYALSVRVDFRATVLNENHWVIDFGGLAEVKSFLVATFDHTLVVAADDPALADLIKLQDLGIANVIILPAVGCEEFACHIAAWVNGWLVSRKHSPRVDLASVEVREHGGNGASYQRTV